MPQKNLCSVSEASGRIRISKEKGRRLKADVPYKSGETIKDEISGLTDAQWVRLRAVSRKWAWLYPQPDGAEDLLFETIGRALCGDRQCPQHIDVVKFLADAMQSVADGEANRLEHQAHHVTVRQPGEEVEGAVDPKDQSMTTEETILALENVEVRRREILALFDDDRQARDLADGILEGYDGEELRMLVDLDLKEFASKRRLFRRRVDKRFPNGWQQ